MGQPQMGGGAVNEPDPGSQHFGETWLKPEELCYQSDWQRAGHCHAIGGSNPWFGVTGRKESRKSVVEVLEGL
jgi:hypothetical protein